MKILELALGILTAVGGFVEIGELVFMSQAGAYFGYRLLWVVVIGTIGIILFGEMSGRVGAVTHQPVFYLIRERAGFAGGWMAMAAANAVSLMTCAAEIAGISIVLKLAMGWPYRAMIVAAFLFLMLSVWKLSFHAIERVFGFLGLCMLVFPIAVWRLAPPWATVAGGLVPSAPPPGPHGLLLYAYLAVGMLSSIMLPYEVYFYSSGGIEDGWKPSDLPTNRITAFVGFTLGSALAATILIGAAMLFHDRGILPTTPGAAALMVTENLGRPGLWMALAGMFFAFAGAAIETGLSGAYNTAQFFGWRWGKFYRVADAPRFTLAWILMLGAATLTVLTGVDPLAMVEYSVIFSVVVLPMSYFPLLLVAADKQVMGKYANGRFANVLGWIFLALLTVAGLAAIPLLILTRGGKA